MDQRATRHLEQTADFLENVLAWVRPQDDIRAVLLVGSFARGEARPDSDVDLVLLTAQPAKYLQDTTWVGTFGLPETLTVEDYGRVMSIRVVYASGLEVELCITDARWAAVPLDPGTEAVASNGLLVLLDRDGEARALAEVVAPHNPLPPPLLVALAQ